MVVNETDWSRYGYCDDCEQTAGNPCFDLRFGRDNRSGLHRARPHRGRPIVVEVARGRPVTIGGLIPGFALGEERKVHVERWAAKHGEMDRAEAIRTLIDRALDMEGR